MAAAVPVRLCALMAFAMLALLPWEASGEGVQNRLALNILCIMSRHGDDNFESRTLASIRRNLRKKYPEAEFYIENLDNRRFPGRSRFQMLDTAISGKYAGDFFRMIVCVGDPALEYAMQSPLPIYNKLPLIFCGVRNPSLARRGEQRNICGVLEKANVAETVDAAMKLQPDTRELVIIYDNTEEGHKRRKIIDESLPSIFRKHPQLDIRYISGRDFSTAQLMEELAALPPHRVCLFSGWSVDKEGLYSDEQALADKFGELSRAPIFTIFEPQPGMTGGKTPSPDIIGAETSRIATLILEGMPPDRIPFQFNADHRFTFDMNKLKQWKFDQGRLPENAEILNLSFYQRHRKLVHATAALVILQTMVIFLLLYNSSRKTRAEKALAANARRLEVILHSIDDAVIATNPDGVITMMNQVAERLTGWRREDAVGLKADEIFRIISTASRKKLCLPIKSAIAKKATIGLKTPLTLIAKDLREYNISDAATPICDDNGDISGVVMVFRDITDEYRQREQIKEAEERFRAMFDNAPLLISLMDCSGNHLFCNRRWLETSSLPHEKLVKLSIQDLTHPDERAIAASQLSAIASGTQTQAGSEKRYLFPNGKCIQVSETIVPIFSARNQVKYIMAIARDTTGESRVRKELQWEREQRELILECVSESIIHLDRNQAIVWSNRHDHNARRGENFYKTILGQDYPPENCPVLECQRFGQPKKREVITRDGKIILVSATPVRNLNGQTEGVVATAVDMTEVRNLEQQLLQAQKMDAVGKLAAGVAHDFNNILQVILGYEELMRARLSDPKAVKIWDNIIEAGKSARNLVRQLLTFSRSTDSPSREITDFNSILDNFRKMLARILGEHIQLQINNANSSLEVLADTGQIEQVLMNLCVNARDAMPNGGRITIRAFESGTPPFPLPSTGTERFLCCEVTDTGCGIPRHLQQRIFEPFFTTKHKSGGTGLGLATTYAIIEKHGGVITVDSNIDQGSTFRFYLPIAEDFRQESSANAISGEIQLYQSRNNETILLVEDEDMVRDIGKTLLESAGYHVIEARDGREGIKMFETHKDIIRLALLDVVLPEKSGKDVANHIAAVNPSLPVIFCSGYTRDIIDSDDIAGKLIMKPYNPDTLLKRIRDELKVGSPDISSTQLVV